MSKLIDIFVEWAHQQRRWPLLFLLAVPAIVKFSEEYFRHCHVVREVAVLLAARYPIG
jgi:hypothetical protein